MCQKKVSVETRHPGCGAIRLFSQIFHFKGFLKTFMIHLLVCTGTNLVKWILSVSIYKACPIRGAVFHGAGSGFYRCSVWFFGSGSCSKTTSLSTHGPPSIVNLKKKPQNHSVKQCKRQKFSIHCEGHINSYYSYFSASQIHLLYYNREV